MAKVSVIVPVFGVEKCIEKCARSLFEQTLDDMEFIFVDDCTKDKSIQVLQSVLEEYPSRSNQVTILHNNSNLGLPRTRRAGLALATGEYIAHCDSDDWVDVNLYEELYRKAVTDLSDIVMCDFCIVTPTGNSYRSGAKSTRKEDFIHDVLFQSVPLSLVNKLFKRTLFDNEIHYTNLNMGEDMAITTQIIRYAEHFSHISSYYYYYNGCTISISREETKAATLKRAGEACKNINYAIEAYADTKDKQIKSGLIHLKFMQRKMYMPVINHNDAYEIWKHTFPEINNHVLFDPRVKISFIDRVKFFLTLIGIFPWIKEHTRKNLQ